MDDFVNKQLALCCDKNLNRWLIWSSEEIRRLLDIWADDHRVQQLEETHENHEIFKMFSKQLKERGFDRHNFRPINRIKAPTWLLSIDFGSLEILPG